MTDLGVTKKLCPNGHLMEPAWDVCPYCPSDRRVPAHDPTGPQPTPHQERPMSSPNPGPELARTIKLPETIVPQAPQAGRRTAIMDRPPTIEGVAWLVGTKDANKGRTYKIDAERSTVGIDPSCDVVLDHEHVSDRHASIRFRDGHFFVTDLDSTNGTFVNDDDAHQHALEDGDRIRFGSSEWVFKCVVFDR